MCFALLHLHVHVEPSAANGFLLLSKMSQWGNKTEQIGFDICFHRVKDPGQLLFFGGFLIRS